MQCEWPPTRCARPCSRFSTQREAAGLPVATFEARQTALTIGICALFYPTLSAMMIGLTLAMGQIDALLAEESAAV